MLSLPWSRSAQRRRQRDDLRDQLELAETETRAELGRQRLRERQLKQDILQSLISTAQDQQRPELFATAIQLLFGQKVAPTRPSGAPQDSQLQQLMLSVLQDRLKSDPLAQWDKLLELDERLRKRIGVNTGGAPEGVNATLHDVLHSPFGEKLGETAGPVLAAVAQQVMARQHDRGVPQPAFQQPPVQTQQLPPPPAPPDPAQLLAELDAATPEQADELATLVLQWAQHYPVVAELVDLLRTADDTTVVDSLNKYMRMLRPVPDPRLRAWVPVLTWLVHHDAMRRAVAVAIRSRVPAPTPTPQDDPELQPLPSVPGVF